MSGSELMIHYLFKAMGIVQPHHLNIKNIISGTKLRVIYWNHTSEAVRFRKRYKIFINERKNDRQQWQEFAHELGHCLLHSGSQSNMSKLFLDYQEKQAEYFSYHFCAPTFMLDNLEEVSINVIVNKFNVEYDFALRRLEMYQSKIINRRSNYARTYS